MIAVDEDIANIDAEVYFMDFGVIFPCFLLTCKYIFRLAVKLNLQSSQMTRPNIASPCGRGNDSEDCQTFFYLETVSTLGTSEHVIVPTL